MKLLHTADLHLGKSLHEQPLVEDQAAMLEALASCLEAGGFDALIIAGDVYDRSIPSQDAVKLFSNFLARVRSIKKPPEILVVPGNHDSEVRLGYGRELFEGLGIHFAAVAGEADRPVIITGADGERCACFLLPFLTPGSLSAKTDDTDEPLRSQADLAREAALRLNKARKQCGAGGIDSTLLVAHLFARGGEESDSERIFLGGAEQVDINLFEGFDYIALGHLHRCQKAGKQGWYSGSPLAYSFGEAGAEKYFISVTISNNVNSKDVINTNTVTVEKIPVVPIRKLIKLKGSFSFFLTESPRDEKIKAIENDYLEITLTGKEIVENALPLLRQRFPFLLSLKQGESLTFERETGDAVSISEGRRDIASDFAEFLGELYGEAEKEKTDLFAQILAETETEEDRL